MALDVFYGLLPLLFVLLVGANALRRQRKQKRRLLELILLRLLSIERGLR